MFTKIYQNTSMWLFLFFCAFCTLLEGGAIDSPVVVHSVDGEVLP